jgi:hypothetical protein
MVPAGDQRDAEQRSRHRALEQRHGIAEADRAKFVPLRRFERDTCPQGCDRACGQFVAPKFTAAVLPPLMT